MVEGMGETAKSVQGETVSICSLFVSAYSKMIDAAAFISF